MLRGRAGAWLACRPGCTQCCHGAFAINALDVSRLQVGMQALHAADPHKAETIARRARAWIAEYGPEFPGDVADGGAGHVGRGQQSGLRSLPTRQLVRRWIRRRGFAMFMHGVR